MAFTNNGSAARLVVAAVLGTVLLPVPASADVPPNFHMPFPCGEVWSGATYRDHSPVEAVDLNRPGDDGDPVVASAEGTVSRAEDDGNTSYGLWVELDHGNGWTTRYGHLSRMDVKLGDRVPQGHVIGLVGSTGHSTGPHLHFEQRLAHQPVRITWDNARIHYWGTRDYVSGNNC